MASRPDCRNGTSGYQYKHWRGRFYPQDLPTGRWFEHYAANFDTVEINNSFYRLPEGEVFASWRKRTPPGFLYAVKYSRFATHMKKLSDPQEPMSRFLSRAGRLASYLGPILVQLPPRWDVNVPRLSAFLKLASRNRRRWAIEFRDERWLTQEVFELLTRYRAALCVHDMIPDHPRITTADWVYLRFHGGHYDGNYDDAMLGRIADEIRRHLAAGRDVYAYFNNDLHGYAINNALTLRAMLRCPPLAV